MFFLRANQKGALSVCDQSSADVWLERRGTETLARLGVAAPAGAGGDFLVGAMSKHGYTATDCALAPTRAQ